MASNPDLEQFRNLTVAVVTGLLEALGEEPKALPTTILALERLGDLLRAGSGVPALRIWSRDISVEVLAACLFAIEYEASEWRLPEGGSTDGLDFVLQRRDEVASFVLAVHAVFLERGRASVEALHWSTLQATLAQVDTRLAAILTQTSGQQLLGLRSCLVDRHSWVNRLPVSFGDRVMALPVDLGEPDDETVYNYLDSGALHRYVEGYAAANPEFAEQLAATFDALEREGELSDALIPRRWRHGFNG